MKYYSAQEDGFFDSNMYGQNIPEDAIEVSDQEYKTLSSGLSSGKCIIIGNDGRPELIIPLVSIGQLLEDKETEVVQKFKAAMTPITGIYTSEDIASFPTQEAEAKAYLADSNADTRFIDGLLANRPTVDKPTLVQRIIDNAATYKTVAGPAIGKKQYYDDQLYALKAQHADPEQPDVTKADIDAIVVDYS